MYMYICNHMVKRAILIIVCELSTLYSHYLRAEKLNVRTHFTHTVVDSYFRYGHTTIRQAWTNILRMMHFTHKKYRKLTKTTTRTNNTKKSRNAAVQQNKEAEV